MHLRDLTLSTAWDTAPESRLDREGEKRGREPAFQPGGELAAAEVRFLGVQTRYAVAATRGSFPCRATTRSMPWLI
jgi:hypothetical protein